MPSFSLSCEVDERVRGTGLSCRRGVDWTCGVSVNVRRRRAAAGLQQPFAGTYAYLVRGAADGIDRPKQLKDS
jgi:hypothetical protein